jgi:hypothetical protein
VDPATGFPITISSECQQRHRDPSHPIALDELLRWHLDRYDRLRASTANRAAVVLSAGALLSAGDALILTQLYSVPSTMIQRWLLVVATVLVVIDAVLVVLSLIQATNVLVTSRDSRTLLAASGPLPPSLLFNAADTISGAGSFARFREVVCAQTAGDSAEAAMVELWVGLQQHRLRYAHLRKAVRLLRWAAVAFLIVLGVAIGVVLAQRL